MAFNLKSQSPLKQEVPPGKVKYGTPEYRSAYKKGEVLSKDGTRSPVALDEVVVKTKPKKEGFWKQSINKYTKENADSGLFGALGSVITYPLQVPQDAATYATTGKVQRPSEALNIKNKVGALAADIALDPVNLVGGSVVKSVAKAGVNALSKKALAPIVKTGKETQKKIIGYLDDASEESSVDELLQEKWRKKLDQSHRKVGNMRIKNIKQFEDKYGSSYSEKDASLFGRLQNTESGKLDPLISNIIGQEADNYKNSELISKSSTNKSLKEDRAFEKKHGIDKNKFTKTDELLNNIYSQGYDSKINRRSLHQMDDFKIAKKTEGTVNRKFYEKEINPRLENLVTKNKLKSEETLYRGDSDYQVGKVWIDGVKQPKGSISFSNLKKGDVWKPGSFVSTSIDKGVASGFGKIKSEIKAPAGQSTLYSNSVKGGQFRGEKEALLPSKLKFKVESRQGTGNNINFKHSIVNPYTVTGSIGGSMIFSGNKKK